MSQICPKCHDPLDEAGVTWTDVRFTWQCQACRKIVDWFMVPFERCTLCGGKMYPVSEKSLPDPVMLEALRTALQMEMLSYNMYRLLDGREGARDRRELLARLMQAEKAHFETLSNRYHIHDPLERDKPTEDLILAWLNQGVDLSAGDGVPGLFAKAVAMEKKALDFYLGLARIAPSVRQRDLYLELAAEEREHAASLETGGGLWGRTVELSV